MTRIEELKKFLSEDPNDTFSSYALALEYVKLNHINDAISLLEKLLQREPEYLAAYYQLGKLFEMNHDFAKSSLTFGKGMEVARKKNDQKTFNELQSALDLAEE